MVKKEIYWDFKTVSVDNFQLKLDFEVEDNIVQGLLSRAIVETKQKIGKKGTGDPSRLPIVPIPQAYYPKLKQILAKLIKRNIQPDIGQDGINIVDFYVVAGEMEKVKSVWWFKIDCQGVYVR